MADSSRPSPRRLAAQLAAGVRGFLHRRRSTLAAVVECFGFLFIVAAGFSLAMWLGLFLLGAYLVVLGNLGGE